MPRYISSNAGTEVPESLFFVDTETTRSYSLRTPTNFLEKFKMGVITQVKLRDNKVVYRETYTFWNIKKFWAFLFSSLNNRKSNWVFAHNLAFDLQTLNIFDKLLDRELIIEERPGDFRIGQPYETKKRPWKGLFVVDSIPCFIRCRAEKGTIVFCDTLNYFKEPLKDLGNQIGLPKMAFPGELATKEQWEAYCLNDVAIIEQLMVPLMQSWRAGNNGNWNYTAPGLAWNNYRHDHAPKIVSRKGKDKVNIVIHDHTEAKSLERQSYHGGQISCFYYGYVSPEKNHFSDRPHTNEMLHHLDIRSLFPFCMAQAKYPVSLQKYYNTGTLAQLEHYSRCAGVIAEVFLQTDKIPFIVKHKEETRYALGKFWTTLAADELGRAIEEGLVYRVGRMAVYQLGPIFKDYVNHWYKEREKARVEKFPHLEKFAKLMLNSLYGKFAQRTPRWVDAPGITPDVDFGQFWHFGVNDTKPKVYRSFAGNVQTKADSVDGSNSFCAISSFVTSNAREYMRQIRELCPENSIYYQHTDSLICNQQAYDIIQKNGLIGPAMGQLRELEEPSNDADFYGPGDYEFGSRIIQTGRKSSAVILGPDTIRQDNFYGLANVIAHGPGEGVNGQSIDLHRSPDRWRKHAQIKGWAVPLVIETLPPVDPMRLE